ncbi:MAG: 3-deoxy-D-manno-octulosonic acid transferase [Deltaproteobacteria bacterium]|nr:3-deoxy-D-manno-octulosonic acid transferase [Deltaproteobacteria bacterium]
MVAWPLRQAGAALLAAAATPLGVAALALRPSWRVGLGERLGLRTPEIAAPVWVHGASVGEILAATRLVDALRAHGHAVLASTTKPTGRSVLARVRPEVPRRLAPLDHPWCVAMALERAAPAALVLVETELWPHWIAAAWRRGVPVAVVSARISDRSFGRYQRVGALARRTLARLSAVGARTAEDARRFVALGLPEECVEITGDLKLEPPLGEPALAPELERALAETPFWVAASTHAGEEEAALHALSAAEAAGVPTALVLAPRYPYDRSAEVRRVVAAHRRRLRVRSRLGEMEPLAPGEVLLLDSLGELPGVIARARLAFVGGSLAPVGGHNVVEPALVARPVVFGPHTHQVRDAAALLLASGGGRRVADATELAAAVIEWLRHPAAAKDAGDAARRAIEPHRGATRRCLRLVERMLEDAAAQRPAG